MTTGGSLKLLLGFMVPLLIGNVFQQMYSIADIIIVGRTIGVNALAAVGAAAMVGTRPGFQQSAADIGIQRGLADAQQVACFLGGKKVGFHGNRLIHPIKIDQPV